MPRVFTRRLVLSSVVRAPDGGGGFLEEWVEKGAFWGEVRMRSGSLRATEFGETPRLRVKIQAHGLPEGHPMRPVPGERIADGGRRFEVEAVHDGDRRILVILARELAEAEGAA